MEIDKNDVKKFTKLLGLSIVLFGGLGLLMRYANILLGGGGGIFILILFVAIAGIYIYMNY